MKVLLITPNNLNDYIVKDDPLPEAYNYLSLVHKADYLRTYFMYHYGGGYADIKRYQHSWKEALVGSSKSNCERKIFKILTLGILETSNREWSLYLSCSY